MLLLQPTTANWANAATCNLGHELLRHVLPCQDWLQTHPTQWTTTTVPIRILFLSNHVCTCDQTTKFRLPFRHFYQFFSAINQFIIKIPYKLWCLFLSRMLVCKQISVNIAWSLNSVSSLDRLVTSPLIIQTVQCSSYCMCLWKVKSWWSLQWTGPQVTRVRSSSDFIIHGVSIVLLYCCAVCTFCKTSACSKTYLRSPASKARSFSNFEAYNYCLLIG